MHAYRILYNEYNLKYPINFRIYPSRKEFGLAECIIIQNTRLYNNIFCTWRFKHCKLILYILIQQSSVAMTLYHEALLGVTHENIFKSRHTHTKEVFYTRTCLHVCCCTITYCLEVCILLFSSVVSSCILFKGISVSLELNQALKKE